MLHSAHNPQPGVSVRSVCYAGISLYFVLKVKLFDFHIYSSKSKLANLHLNATLLFTSDNYDTFCATLANFGYLKDYVISNSL